MSPQTELAGEPGPTQIAVQAEMQWSGRLGRSRYQPLKLFSVVFSLQCSFRRILGLEIIVVEAAISFTILVVVVADVVVKSVVLLHHDLRLSENTNLRYVE